MRTTRCERKNSRAAENATASPSPPSSLPPPYPTPPPQVLVTTLEEEFYKTTTVTLQKMYFYMQPSMRTMDILDSLITTTHQYTGGELINKIRAYYPNTGDVVQTDLIMYIVSKATQPYFHMLQVRFPRRARAKKTESPLTKIFF